MIRWPKLHVLLVVFCSDAMQNTMLFCRRVGSPRYAAINNPEPMGRKIRLGAKPELRQGSSSEELVLRLPNPIMLLSREGEKQTPLPFRHNEGAYFTPGSNNGVWGRDSICHTRETLEKPGVGLLWRFSVFVSSQSNKS